MEILLYAIIGFAVGLITGVFGIGGGSVRIPLLVMTGMPLIVAFATNMFSIPFTSATGAYVQRNNIDWKIVWWFIAGATIGIIIATLFVGIVSSRVLAVMFFLAAIATVLGLYLENIFKRASDAIKADRKTLFASAFFGNLIIGLRGGSGGSLFPSLLRSMHIEMHRAVATSLFAGLFSSIAALAIYAYSGHVLIIPGLVVAGTGILGSYVGSRVSMNADEKWLKLGLAVIVVGLALTVVYPEFF